MVSPEFGFDTPFVLVSGMSPEEAAVLMKQIRADDCVLKSEADEMLLPIVRRQLREAEKRRRRGEG